MHSKARERKKLDENQSISFILYYQIYFIYIIPNSLSYGVCLTNNRK